MIRIYTILTLCFLLSGSASAQNKSNSFKPGAIWTDTNGQAINAHGGGITYVKGKYYWFGEHKVGGEKGNKAYVGIHVYSSANLYQWKDEGIALAVDSSAGSQIAPGSIIERPKVIYNPKTKQYVMWFHLELKDRGYKAALAAVAISSKITGPYKFHHAERPDRNALPVGYQPDANHADSLVLRDKDKGQMSRDMNLFVDNDGSAYLVYTSEENRTLHISRLSDNYLYTTGQFVRVFPNRYMEAAAIFKSNGKYFFVGSGCTGWAPNAARSAVANHIFGPWKELGNPCMGPDSALTFHGQSTFVFPVAGRKNTIIFVADRWNPKDAIDGRYLWLPVTFKDEGFHIKWADNWNLTDINQ